MDLRQQHKFEMERQAQYLFKSWAAWPTITRQDILDWFTHLRSSGLKDRTIRNRYVILKTFQKWAGVTIPNLPDAPTIPRLKPRVCSDEQLDKLLTTCSPILDTAVRMLAELGLQKRELMYAAWSDIDWTAGQFTVTEKPDLDFTIKTRTERHIAINDGLLNHLHQWRAYHPHSRLILETRTGKPHHSLLKRIKAEATKAGLDPKEFGLHMLRKKFVTTLLRARVDIKTASVMAGHS